MSNRALWLIYQPEEKAMAIREEVIKIINEVLKIKHCKLAEELFKCL